MLSEYHRFTVQLTSKNFKYLTSNIDNLVIYMFNHHNINLFVNHRPCIMVGLWLAINKSHQILVIIIVYILNKIHDIGELLTLCLIYQAFELELVWYSGLD